MTDTTTTDAAPATPPGAWHRLYPDGWEFLLPGGEVLRVPYEATGDGPLHEDLQRFADGLHLAPTDGTARPANVIEALARCIRDMPAVGKDQEMNSREGGGQSYKYRSIEAVTSHASELFGRYVIVVKPHKIRRSVRDVPMGREGKIWTEDLLKVKYRIYGPGGRKDFIDTAYFHALARDNSDKGTNKAMTQAYKQCLLQLLVVGDNKDDPDSYGNRSEGTAEEAPERPPTIEEWSLANGWDSNEDRNAAVRHARARLKAEVEAGGYTPDQATELWEGYKRPPRESLDGGEGPRTFTEHAQWMAAHLPLHPSLPEPAAAPQTPPPATPAPPDPEPATAPDASSEPGVVAESEQAGPVPAQAPDAADAVGDKVTAPQEPAPASVMQQLDAALAKYSAETIPPPAPETEPTAAETFEDKVRATVDNFYRGALDQALQDGGVDSLIAAMRELDITQIVAELRIRDVEVVGKHSADSLRRELGSLIIRWHNMPDPTRRTRRGRG